MSAAQNIKYELAIATHRIVTENFKSFHFLSFFVI